MKKILYNLQYFYFKNLGKYFYKKNKKYLDFIDLLKKDPPNNFRSKMFAVISFKMLILGGIINEENEKAKKELEFRN